jgi:protein involved in polysaccharide export with SLBB domain
MSLIRYFFILLILAATPAPAETQLIQDSDDLLVLVPGDILRVAIWREPNLSGDFQVDQDGTLVLPLLGKLQVSDRAWNVAKDDLMEDYLQELRNPSIELIPFRSVYVLGEVNLPGRYNVHPTNDNLAGAVSLAGGVTPDGDITHMRIIRDGVILLDGIVGEQRLAELGIRSGDQLFIGRRGWLDRNSTFIASAILSLSGIVVAILAGGGGG